jgi:photosystem II stability/assembly factor-like uncharacterized protein
MEGTNMTKNMILGLFVMMTAVSVSLAQSNFWVQTSGPFGGTVYTLATTPDGRIFAGTDLSGIVYLSTNKGATWAEAGNGLSAYTVVQAIAVLKPAGYVLAGSSDGMYRTTDNGSNWIQVGLSGTLVTAMATDTAGRIFAGTSMGQFYRSTDTGATWHELDPGNPLRGAISSIIVDSHDHIFAGAGRIMDLFGGGIYRSLDHGNNWSVADSGLLYYPIQSLALGVNGDLYAGGLWNGVFRSTDDGHYWNATSWADTALNGLIVNSKGTIFAGSTGGGVYVSSDNGDSWDKDTTGMITHAVHCFVLDTAGYLYAGTEEEGVYRSALSTTTGVGKELAPLPVAYALLQNYPNPFNPSTLIRYALPERSWVELGVYDLMGREVATLVEGTVEAGVQEAVWDAAGKASGVYYYRLNAASLTRSGKEFSHTGKMVLLR